MKGELERELNCPHCGRSNDRHGGWKGKLPKPGDVGICWKCRELAILTPFLFLRKPSPEEAAELERDPDVRRALAAMTESYTPYQAVELMREGD